jgi:hypothetical protein
MHTFYLQWVCVGRCEEAKWVIFYLHKTCLRMSTQGLLPNSSDNNDGTY